MVLVCFIDSVKYEIYVLLLEYEWKMNMVHQWNNAYGTKPQNLGKKCVPVLLIHKSHMDWPGLNPSHQCDRTATNNQSHDTVW